MSLRIEDYALIGDTQTAALVGANGSIDWLCLPRFDAGACFAALLGDRTHGRWQIAPVDPNARVRRRYRDDTLVLETEFHTPGGVARLVDLMPISEGEHDVVRVVEGVRGRVDMAMELILRFDYGRAVPWVRRVDGTWRAIAGPDAVRLETPVEPVGKDLTTTAAFVVEKGDRIPFRLTWYRSHEAPPDPRDPFDEVDQTEKWWRAWMERCTYEGPWAEQLHRSLITLKALTYAPTGGIVAAATTSLPERLGGIRNWDYRYCWLRDATFTLYCLIAAGFTDEAARWREWLLRAVAGHPAQLAILYGVAGERLLPEIELSWLPGYENSAPVRIGNKAVEQFQLDVFGELMDTMHVARKAGIGSDRDAWDLQLALMDELERVWRDPDEGIWEVRGGARPFTHSKVMAWVAVDRAIKAVERFGQQGPVDRWRRLSAEIQQDVLAKGFDPGRGAFIQAYDHAELDASLLMLPLVGFIDARDERMLGTVRAIERELLVDGLVYRYSHEGKRLVDGLEPGEGAFLPCSFWLAENYVLQGRRDEARALFERLLAVGNDVGLFSEEYDPIAGRQLGNVPQAMTHVALVAAICTLSGCAGRGVPRPEARGDRAP